MHQLGLNFMATSEEVTREAIQILEDNYSNWSNDFNTHVGELTEQVFDWAEVVFPNRNDASMYLKMYGEIAEMIESDGDANEIADMFILLLDYSKRKKVDVTTAVLRKLSINRKRTWATDKNGVNSHVK
ncbi:Domain of unknown function DUF550 [uncultured Caudovirales phage]|uniref:dATP/dGTP diphosphohydrolase MazZ domain-containing protein n=1 Tax=uncultured Caudovirales phage TaxID=2100421 RepID=A0A6J7XHB9_9CAUD|nr:Domain of unknown function DUF550 [uncultured Caudovirales phage]